MKKATLQRLDRHDGATRGILTDQGGTLCIMTLEPTNRRLPAGDYICLPDDTGKHKHWIIMGWEAANWPTPFFEWSRVEWHAGNTVADTEACILPGLGFGIFDIGFGITNSRDALKLMHAHFGTEMWALRIEEPYEVSGL